MIRRVALLVTIFILSLTASALAAESGSGIIEGQVVNKTEGGSSVGEQDITLRTYRNGNEVDPTPATTDDEGRFVFDGLSTEAGYSYQVTLIFQEADYYSERLIFGEGEISKPVEVTVYVATTSDEAIRVEMAHTIIYVEQGTLLVEEYFRFFNEADRTYIGLKEAPTPGGKETLRFSLPAKAAEVQYGAGLMGCCIVIGEDGFVDTMPVLPGVKEVAYSYKVKYSAGAYTFSKRVNYPTASFDLLVQGEGTKVASDQLITGEPLNFEGILFNHLSGKDLAPGSILVVDLSGLPKANNQGTIIWVALALVILAGFGFGYLLRKKRLQPVSAEGSLDQRRQRLLVELARLDDAFEAGKIDEEIYRRLRAERKAQLAALIQKKSSGNR